MNGPYVHEVVHSDSNGDLHAVKDASETLAYAQSPESADLIVHALNSVYNSFTRRSDPVTSEKAARRASVTRSKRCQQAVAIYATHGDMHDEMLHLNFTRLQVPITPDTVRHIRKNLESAGLVEYKGRTTKTENDCDARVYGLVVKSEAQHD